MSVFEASFVIPVANPVGLLSLVGLGGKSAEIERGIVDVFLYLGMGDGLRRREAEGGRMWKVLLPRTGR